MNKTCQKCGRSFVRKRRLSDEQWKKRKFCSKRCSALRLSYCEADIVNMYTKGKLSSAEIGEKLNISSAHILRILHKNKVNIRGNSENKKLCSSRESFKRKLSLANRGKKLKEESKEKLRKLIGNKNPNWGGGITINSSGYIVFTNSKANGEHANKFLHSIIAEWLYGRKIKKGEHVHHIDGNKLNNNPDNLTIIAAEEHAKLHNKKEY